MKKAPLFLSVLCVLLGLALWQCLAPDREISDLENRTLQKAPSFSVSSFVSGAFYDDLEKYAADQAPLRDEFVALNALMESAQGRPLRNSVIFGADGYLFDRTDLWNSRNARMNAEGFDALAEKTGVPAYLALVPSSGAVYEEKLPAGSPRLEEEILLSELAGENSVFIDLLSPLRAQKAQEGLYFRTDHHWALNGARVGYEAICKALSLTPFELTGDVTGQGFFGSFFARSPSPLIRGDELIFPDPEGITLKIAGETQAGLYDREKILSRDQYAGLLYGNHGLLELENAQSPGGTLFVLKDSYANLLLPTLARHYSRVIAVDARYFTGDIVETVKESEADQLLCLFGLSTFSQGRSVALLRGL